MRKLKTDVLVIGSGMGGLSAAALLARGGYRVFVMEKLSRIGGRCSTLEIDGYCCTSGVLAVEVNGIVSRFFEEVNAPFDVQPAGALTCLIKSEAFQVPRKSGLKALLEATDAGQDAVEKVMSAMSKALNWREPSPGISLYDWIRQYTKHPDIMQVFQVIVKAALMVNVEEVSARYFFSFAKTLEGGNEFGYCTKGSAALPEALGQVVMQQGGDIWTEATVTRILSDHGVVQGVLLKQGERDYKIEAQVVISDTGPKKTVELVGQQKFDKDYLEELEEKLKPTAVVCLQVGLEKPLFAQNHLLLVGSRRVHAVYQPSVINPDLAPEGKHLLIANSIPKSLKSVTSEKGRQAEIEACLADLKAVFPAFEKSAAILMTGVYRDYWPGMHAWPGKDMPIKTPIINLYNVGDGVKQGEYSGLPAVVKTGMMVADEIRDRKSVFNGDQTHAAFYGMQQDHHLER